jgi:hypothetical protein
MLSVFISYSSIDREVADDIADNLKKHNVDVFIDYQRLKGGDDFIEKLGREIDRCDYFILLFSNNSARSKWVRRETAYAFHKEKTVVPIILELVDDMAAWFPIVGLHQVNFKRWNEGIFRLESIRQLLEAIGITERGTSSVTNSKNELFVVSPNEVGFASGRYTDEVSFNEFENIIGGISLYKTTEAQTSKVWARWTPTINETDAYQIQVFIPKIHSSTKNARYKINNVGNVTGEIVVAIDQSQYHNEWVTLGDYELNKSVVGAGTIFLNDLTLEIGHEISFTSIRFRQLFARG